MNVGGLKSRVVEKNGMQAAGVKSRQFIGANGEQEHYFIVEPDPDLNFLDQLHSLQTRYEQALAIAGLPLQSAAFRRVFLSDAINQSAVLRTAAIADEDTRATALSVIGQSPIGGAKLSMLAYHLEGPGRVTRRRLSPHHLLIERHGSRHLWSTGLCTASADHQDGAGRQTTEIFGNLVRQLTGLGGGLKRNCVRTWLYLKDVDVFYQDMVEARRDLFETEGLSADTHYIASTGIEGACSHALDLVSMDAYSILDLRPGQMTYLNDYSRLCATKKYGVTFERATRVAFSDRAQLYISGTAAIDTEGRVLHPGDVIGQLDYALENVAALLRAGQSSFADMMYLLVYLRDPSDHAKVGRYLASRFGDLPILIVQGAVCRPEWLVEVEGQAIASLADPSMPQF
jgi:enamine deaminase RidA (YjgF/YER057c/UK114 family)